MTARRYLVAVFSLIALAGCGKSLPALTPPAAQLNPQVARPHGTATATISFPIPAESKKNTVGFVSPHTGEVVIRAGGREVLDATIATGSKRFAKSFTVPSGSVKFTIELDDAFGDGLSAQQLTQTMTAGKTTALKLALRAIPYTVRPVTANPYPPVGRSTTISVSFNVFDAQSDPLTFEQFYQPVKIALDNAGGHMKLKQTQLTSAGQSLAVAYDGGLMTAYDVLRPANASSTSQSALKLLGNAYTAFPLPDPSESIRAITPGPNHTMLFAACNATCSISSIDPTGTIKPIGTVQYVNGMTFARNSIWITEGGEYYASGGINKMSLTGSVTHLKDSLGTYAIAAAPDGTVWFGDTQGIAEITNSDRIKHYKVTASAIPLRSKTVMVEGSYVYFDDGSRGICEIAVTGRGAKCTGTQTPDSYSNPVWGGNDTLIVWDHTANELAKLDSSLKKAKLIPSGKAIVHLVPMLLSDNGTLLGFGDPHETYFPSNDNGIVVAAVKFGLLTETGYPGLSLPAASGSGYNSAGKLAVSDQGVIWLTGTNELLRFSDKL